MTEAFCRDYQCSEETDHDPETGQEYLPTTRTFYPTPSDARPEMHASHYLPEGVLPIYREALFASANELPISAGFAIRAIVEAVCIDKSVPGRTLESRIDGLASNGLITTAAASILHNLRFMGNAAAHEMKAHSAAEISTAIDVAEILLQNVYVLPKLAETLA